MKRFLIASTIVFGLANGGLACAQSSAPGSGSAVISPSMNVDNGIIAKGSANQQSPAADTKGTPEKMPPTNSGMSKPSGSISQSDAPGSSHNALTQSPKGPGTGGNDATK